jgi:hypothetical protein
MLLLCEDLKTISIEEDLVKKSVILSDMIKDVNENTNLSPNPPKDSELPILPFTLAEMELFLFYL